MTDEERTALVIETIRSGNWSTQAVVEAVAGALAAVRLDERRTIVAYLRRRVQEVIREPLVPPEANTTAVYVASVDGEATRIERGEHAGGGEA